MTATRHFKLASILIIAAAAMAAFVPNASALGPGGWDNLGERPPAGSGIPSLFGQRVDSMNTDSGSLIVGGLFDGVNQASGVTPDDDRIAIYDGRTWSTLGPGQGDMVGGASSINALEYANGKIYAAGTFQDAGPTNADFLAVWDTNNPGAGWQAPCGGPTAFTGNVASLLIVGNTLYIGGPYDNAGGNSVADSITSCDLTTGALTAITDTDEDVGGSVASIVQAPNGNIYMGGQFINVDGIAAADYVVQYNGGTSWSALGGTAAIDTINVDSLATDASSNLYVGTDDLNIAGIAQADHIAKWDGANWSALGSNTATTDGYLPAAGADVQAIAVNGSDVYAFGNFNNADGNPVADRIARFNTTSGTWFTVGHNGTNTDGPIACNICGAIAIFHGKLHVGGNFVNAGGDPLADSIACFPGATPCIEPAPVVTPPAPPPATPAAPTATTPPKRCKKGQKLRKGRCVKRKKRKK